MKHITLECWIGNDNRIYFSYNPYYPEAWIKKYCEPVRGSQYTYWIINKTDYSPLQLATFYHKARENGLIKWNRLHDRDNTSIESGENEAAWKNLKPDYLALSEEIEERRTARLHGFD